MQMRLGICSEANSNASASLFRSPPEQFSTRCGLHCVANVEFVEQKECNLLVINHLALTGDGIILNARCVNERLYSSQAWP